MKKDQSTPENREFWEDAADARRVVGGWPVWKRGGPAGVDTFPATNVVISAERYLEMSRCSEAWEERALRSEALATELSENVETLLETRGIFRESLRLLFGEWRGETGSDESEDSRWICAVELEELVFPGAPPANSRWTVLCPGCGVPVYEEQAEDRGWVDGFCPDCILFPEPMEGTT